MTLGIYARLGLRGALLEGQPFGVEETYLSLHDDDPGDDGGAELTGGPGPYRRVRASWRDGMNVGRLEFRDLPAGPISHVGIWDAPEDGNFLMGIQLASRKWMQVGDAFRFEPETITTRIE